MIRPARHIVQILGLDDGRVIALGERDCSAQRRFQKVVEETPAGRLTASLRARLLAAGVAAGRAVGYRGAGTVEFLLDPHTDEFVFLEMNTRLQVEHPITELVTRLDLVELQLRIAAGEAVNLTWPTVRGHAIEFRIYAEDPVRFLPTPGQIETWVQPEDPWVRVDSGYGAGTDVTPYYAPLVAKLCVHGEDRAQAVRRSIQALDEFQIAPITTNLEALRRIASSDRFTAGDYDTSSLDNSAL
ncbi:ATP-binding protein [Rhodococcus sp. WAY2]|uniref:ATP-binding protein n=1 Tax=Rhodococcus sp. WAY2 TaxID=2663121 RepID=UPI0013201A14|nr:hypothetical protein [Rhodococcus sp. WAY2]QHE72563.1 Methylcrotonyl-CoA carboxylase biotin-containing subunit [Rhodococcus sp. WAY2]